MAIPPHRKVGKDKKYVQFNMEIQYHNFKYYFEERNTANLPWMTALKRQKAGLPSSLDGVANTQCIHRSTYHLKDIDHADRSPLERETWQKVLQQADTQARVRAVQMHLNCITTLSALPLVLSCCGPSPSTSASAAPLGYHTDELERDWIYDTGAGLCLIGWDHLTIKEKSNTFQCAAQNFTTAGGIVTSTTAVMCNVPYIGERFCYVLKDCPPAISVRSDVMDHGVTFSYSRESGPSVSLPDGTIVYLDTNIGVPTLNGFCKSDNAWKPNKRTETLAMSSTADFVCSPCGQATPEPWTKGSINATVAPAMAAKTIGTDGEPWSGRPPAPARKPITSRSTSSRERMQLCPERQRDGTTPKLTLPEDEAIGNRHGASARSVSAK